MSRLVISKRIIYLFSSLILLQPTTVSAVENQATVQIGYQGPLSGAESPLGISQLDAVKYAVGNFNDFYQGQIKVEIKTYDDQGDPSVAVKVAPLTAADSKTIGLVGPAYSGASIASLPYYKELSLPMVSPSASRGDLTNQFSTAFGSPVFHRVIAVEKQKGARVNNWAIQGIMNPRIFLITDSYRPAEWITSLAPSANRAGVLNMNDYFGKETTIISIIMSSSPNVVIIDSFEAKAELLKSLRKAGYSGRLIATDNWSYEQNIQAAQLELEGLQFVELTPSSLSAIDSQLESEFVAKTDRASREYSSQTIDATNVLLSCIANGVRARLEMIDCVKSYKGKSITGEYYSFDKFGDSTNPFLTINTLAQGQIVREKFIFARTVPQLSNIVTTKDGFEFEISNYDPKGNYWIKSSAGKIKQLDNIISVTNLEPGQTANVNVASSLQLLKFNSNTIVAKAGLTPEQIEKETKLAIEKILAEASAKADAIKEAQKVAEAKIEAERKIAEAKALADKIVADAKAASIASANKKKTITCFKGNQIKRVTATKPKCPTGYKLTK